MSYSRAIWQLPFSHIISSGSPPVFLIHVHCVVTRSSDLLSTVTIIKACPHWIRIQTGLVTELPNANSMQIQCASIASTPGPLYRTEFTRARLTSSGHTSTQLPWHAHQIFTSASHHIAIRVKQIRGTLCSLEASRIFNARRWVCKTTPTYARWKYGWLRDYTVCNPEKCAHYR